ncbi:MAG: Ldh family oxidoreductase [Candidatus Latescibacterota bacterium]|nr:Ldh family oxidoreductase [Candidatus Latescibacterota bacterium]
MAKAWDDDRRVDAVELMELVGAIFRACGMDDADAHLLADSLVYADLGGVHSHGVLRVPKYAVTLTADGVNPRGRPEVVREMGACLVVDGHNAMGQIGCHFAMERAIEKAEEHGIGAAAVRGSNHCGAMAYFAMQAIARDMIGWATTNALPTMAPWGGTERIIGINPLGVAVPAGREYPIVFDAAFSGSSHGKIRIHHQKGLALPEGWALNSKGQPTTDPAAAIDGLLMPIGQFKGVALAMIMGLFSSLLSGAAYGAELGNMEDGPQAGADGHFVMAINAGAFEEVERFKERVDRAIEEVHGCRKAPGVERVYAPGEKEFLCREVYGREGVPLNEVTLAGIGEAAREVGVDVTE